MTEDTQKIMDAMMNGFAGINREFEKMHAGMTCVEERMDRMEDRMGKMEDQMGKFEDRMEKMEVRMEKLEDRVGKIETDVRVIREILVDCT